LILNLGKLYEENDFYANFNLLDW